MNDVPSLVPVGLQNLHCFGQRLRCQPLEENCETAALFGPRHVFLLDAMLRSIHPRHGSMQNGLKLATVQMPPTPLRSVIVTGQLGIALRATKLGAGRVFDMHVNLLPIHVKRHLRRKPRRLQAQKMLVKFFILHECSPARRILTGP